MSGGVMRLKIKLEKYGDHCNDGKQHMFEIMIDNSTSKFESFDISSIDGVRIMLNDINEMKQAIEDYLCEHA
jgi:RNA-binding protein YlmH